MRDLAVQSVVASLRDDEDGWHTRILITYEDGATEHLQGDLLDASELAGKYGLTLVPSPDESLHWIRLPQTWDQV